MNDIKKEMMVLAKWLSPEETMTAIDAAQSLQAIVAQVCADASPTVTAVIAVRLAAHLEQQAAT